MKLGQLFVAIGALCTSALSAATTAREVFDRAAAAFERAAPGDATLLPPRDTVAASCVSRVDYVGLRYATCDSKLHLATTLDPVLGLHRVRASITPCGYDTHFADLRPDASGKGLKEHLPYSGTPGYQSSELRTVRVSPLGIIFRAHYTNTYGGATPGVLAYTTYCWGAPHGSADSGTTSGRLD